MSYGIVRVQKFSAGSVKGIEIHDCRKKADEQISHTNKDIEWSRTAQNYDLCPEHQNNFNWAVKERIEQLNLARAVRKDAVVLAQVLVTSDSSFFAELLPEQQRQFFQDSYDFLVGRYGKQNVISATVHLDERTPHMHFNFVPVTEDGRLCARDVLTRQALIQQQDAFAEQVGKTYGLERGEPEGSNKRRVHLETEEFKEQKQAEKYALGKAAEARTSLFEVSKQVSAAEAVLDAYKGVQGKIEAIAGIQPKRAFGTVVLKQAEFEVLHEQAQAYAANSPELERMRQLQQQLHVRQQAVADREKAVSEQEQSLAQRADSLNQREQQLRALELRQQNINSVLAETEERLEKANARRRELFAENKSLHAQIDAVAPALEHSKHNECRCAVLERNFTAVSQVCARMLMKSSPLYQPNLTPDGHAMLLQVTGKHDDLFGLSEGTTLVEYARKPLPEKTLTEPEQYRKQQLLRQREQEREDEEHRQHSRDQGFER